MLRHYWMGHYHIHIQTGCLHIRSVLSTLHRSADASLGDMPLSPLTSCKSNPALSTGAVRRLRKRSNSRSNAQSHSLQHHLQ